MFNIIPNGSNSAARATIVVAVAGQSLTSTGMRSPDNGLTWATITYPAVESWRDIQYGGGRFVGLGKSGISMISTDGGLTFVSGGALPDFSHPNPKDWSYLAYSASRNRWMAAPINPTSTTMAISDDGGESWDAITVPAHAEAGLTYLNDLDRFIYRGNGRWLYSGDGGSIWNEGDLNSFARLGATTYVSGTEYVCYTRDASVAPFSYYSTNGSSFTLGTTVGAAGSWGYVCGGHGMFIASPTNGSDRNQIAYSTDGGDNWGITVLTYSGDISDLSWTISPTQFGFVGLPSGTFGGQNLSMRSSDGMNWTIDDNSAASANWTKCATPFAD